MILIGQYDSPFVRRVAVSLRLLGLEYEHRPWSVFSDAAEVGGYNPLCRVPVLVLEDGEVLIESGAILDHLDEGAGTRRLLPAAGPERRRQLQIAALATGLAEKAVALVYERAMHEETSAGWIARCEGQVGAVLARLEAEVAALAGPFFAGGGAGAGGYRAGLRAALPAGGPSRPVRCRALAGARGFRRALRGPAGFRRRGAGLHSAELTGRLFGRMVGAGGEQASDHEHQPACISLWFGLSTQPRDGGGFGAGLDQPAPGAGGRRALCRALRGLAP